MQATTFEVTSITFGLEFVASPLGSQPVEIRIYRDPTPGHPAPVSEMTLLHTELFMVQDNSLILVTQDMHPPAPFPVNGDDLVVEIFYPDGMPTMDHLFFGSNNLGQTAPGYLAATACGVSDPTDLAVLGFPSMHIILDVNIAPPSNATLGIRCCSPAVNSTGLESLLIIAGSLSVTSNNLSLLATNTPAG